MDRSSRVLQHGNPKIWIFFKKIEIEFWLVPKSWNHLNFVNISPTLVIDASMERSSRVLQHGNPYIWFFFKEMKFNFDLCHRAEIIQVGLNMNLYGDIGDASSSLRGSTSSQISGLAISCIWLVCLNSLFIPPSVTVEVYCFPRRQLIFSFGRRVISFERSLWVHSEIDSGFLYHDLHTNSWTSFLS